MNYVKLFITILLIDAGLSTTIEFGDPKNAQVKLASSQWIVGPKGICKQIPIIPAKMEACQGEKSYSDKSLDVQSESIMLPGAAFGQQGPVNKLIKYPKYGSTGPTISYIFVEFQFALDMGTANLITGGVGSSSALIQLVSPRCSGYVYRVEFWTKRK